MSKKAIPVHRSPTHPGELMREIIEEHARLSVTDAARRMGVSRQALHAVLRGRSAVSADMARQENWDPYLLTGQCEQAVHGADELVAEMLKLQVIEFETLFDYCWRQSGVHQAG